MMSFLSLLLVLLRVLHMEEYWFNKYRKGL